MSIFGRTASIGIAWLTAVMTLVAALPHFECHCPNGQVKPICLGIASKKSGCCCGRNCCSSSSKGHCCCQACGVADARRGNKSCCGSQHGANLIAKSARGVTMQASGCVKTMAFAKQLAPGRHEILKATQIQSLCLASSSMVLYSLPGAPNTVSQAHSPAPPPDLITTLQRLVI